ncbi:MAG: phosphoribosylformylglycinamidine cyclo-ligase [Chitinispirillales bacterium]|jgi:phosphoribosylformylglycinamidine cyclo-ligase|nr:phosphoribosylformylglycinamidine cyclo-ligase [Chitinispirillales bacterium]
MTFLKKTGKSISYADAGVNLAAWDDTKERIGKLVKTTYNDKVVGKFGQFGGMFNVSFFKDMKNPILVSSVDGVGTKLKIAVETGVHNTVGYDIVNHCIDDILVMGARPLVFLDYIATGILSPKIIEQIVKGLSQACRESKIALIGGETAEMPGMYREGDYDIAGTIVGVVDEEKVIDGSKITKGDVVIGLSSSGLHTNGYSLARKIVREIANKKYDDIFEPENKTFGEVLLRPHLAYTPLFSAINKGYIKGIAHLTGGGFQNNIDRILPDCCNARININSWIPLPIFKFLVERGNMKLDEAYRTFNMGIGLIAVIAKEDAQKLLNEPDIRQFVPAQIGEIVNGSGDVELVGEW